MAHTDDETLGTGGILAKYAAQWVETHSSLLPVGTPWSGFDFSTSILPLRFGVKPFHSSGGVLVIALSSVSHE
jgi:hypothetical protein